jgi:hypothetical protein
MRRSGIYLRILQQFAMIVKPCLVATNVAAAMTSPGRFRRWGPSGIRSSDSGAWVTPKGRSPGVDHLANFIWRIIDFQINGV